MTVLKFTHPCNDCPFRRASTKGWCGAAEPEWFVQAALADEFSAREDLPEANAAPCHQTVDYDDPDWIETLPDAAACAGAMIFARNLMKLPRDPMRAQMVQAVQPNRLLVFDNPVDFVHHHRDPEGMRSWEQN